MVPLVLLLSACGGGGGSGGKALASLEVVPASATVVVGGTAQYGVVARDGAGLVMATPPVFWAAATPSVGSITPDGGMATGLSLGQTAITATVGSVVSPPVKFNVVENAACDGIAAVPVWNASLEFQYIDTIKTPKGQDVHADHYASVTSALTLAGTGQNKVYWSGALVGGRKPNGTIPVYNQYVSFFETFTDLISDPTVDAAASTVFGDTNPVPTPGEDGFRLEVDLSSCTFQFFVAPSAHVTANITTHAKFPPPLDPNEGTKTYPLTLPMGLLQKGSTPLGSWRTGGLGDYSKNLPLFPSYSVGVTIPTNLDGYIPSGIYNQGLFFDLAQPVPRQNTTIMSYGMVPQL
jgi:hypothetical protein